MFFDRELPRILLLVLGVLIEHITASCRHIVII